MKATGRATPVRDCWCRKATWLNLERRPYVDRPIRHEYWLVTMITWGDKWMADEGGPPLRMTHVCGHAPNAELVCAHCRQGAEPKSCTTSGSLTRPPHAANSWSSQNASLPAHRAPGNGRGERESPGTPTSLIPSWRAGWPGQPRRSESRARPLAAFGRGSLGAGLRKLNVRDRSFLSNRALSGGPHMQTIWVAAGRCVYRGGIAISRKIGARGPWSLWNKHADVRPMVNAHKRVII